VKFCKDCRFFTADTAYDRCAAPEVVFADPVHGKVSRFAKDARRYEGLCGPSARHYEPRLLDRTISSVKGLFKRAAT